MADLFGLADPDEDERPADNRCTPEKLLAYLKRCRAINGKSPTLAEVKQEFGGILGPLLDGWELERQGLLP